MSGWLAPIGLPDLAPVGALHSLLLLAGGGFSARQLLLLLAAEQGRKQDLVRRLYRANTTFVLSVLIPYLERDQFVHLASLLQAIEDQDYPSARVVVHVVTHPDLRQDLDALPLRPNVRVWTHPSPQATPGVALGWLIERCLAQGDSTLLVFLKPDDLIKPDFFQNLVIRSFDSFVIQGYVALKTVPPADGAPGAVGLGRVMTLSNRLFNRVTNAGRYHLGLSCRLLDTGWAIKQDVLEMVPYRRGDSLDNLEYTLRLNLESFRVTWAPNVVVYSRQTAAWLPVLANLWRTALDRLRMALTYGPSLLIRGLTRVDLGLLELLASLVKPPTALLGALLLVPVVLATVGQLHLNLPQFAVWAGLTTALLGLQVLGLLVARCRPADVITFSVYTPWVYALGLLLMPAAILKSLSNGWRQAGKASAAAAAAASSRATASTRLNEDLPPLRAPNRVKARVKSAPVAGAPREVLDLSAMDLIASPVAQLQDAWPQPAEPAETQPPAPPPPRFEVTALPLSNGERQVDCQVTTETLRSAQGEAAYRMTLTYKSVAVTTAAYRMKDQAFYELQTKLAGRGLSIVSCGSCAYFYHPTAETRQTGYCLYGKLGRDVSVESDGVTVTSSACRAYTSMTEREHVVREWRESLAYAAPLDASNPLTVETSR